MAHELDHEQVVGLEGPAAWARILLQRISSAISAAGADRGKRHGDSTKDRPNKCTPSGQNYAQRISAPASGASRATPASSATDRLSPLVAVRQLRVGHLHATI